MTTLKWIGLLAAAALVGLTAGCQQKGPPPAPEMHGEAFVPDSDTRAVWDIRTVQAAAGARHDATLYGCHFNQTGLNTLGRQKLDLMLADETPTEPLIVYVNLPADAPAEKDRMAVLAYLSDRGLHATQVELRDGPNPQTSASASDAASTLKTLQSGAGPNSSQTAQPGGTPAAGLTPNAPSMNSGSHY